MKRLLLIIACAALLAETCIQLYNRFLNPDLQFFLKVAEASDTWAEHIHAADRPVYVLAGGSEARSGVNPQILLDEFGMPLVNAGESAGYGLQANAALAFRYLKPGDTMVLSILNTSDINVPPTSEGIKISFYRMGTGVFSCGHIKPCIQNLAKLVQPNFRSFAVWITRYFAKNGRTYKYQEKTIIHSSGWMEIQHRDMAGYKPYYVKQTIQYLPSTSPLFIAALHDIKEACTARGIRLVITIPRACNLPDSREQIIHDCLEYTKMGIPVIKDECLGCLPDSDFFADTPVHLNAKGAREYSMMLGEALRDNRFWSRKELEELLDNFTFGDGNTTEDSAQ